MDGHRDGKWESAKYWTTPALAGGNLLTARFREQRFGRHWHDTYVIALILSGAQQYWYRGRWCTAPRGTLVVINPGEVHTGESGTASGWAYRAFYPTTDWTRDLRSTPASRAHSLPWFPETPIDDKALVQRLTAAHRLLERGEDLLEAETRLLSAWDCLVGGYAMDRSPLAYLSRDPARVACMQSRLADDPTEAMTLTRLGADVGLSPWHAARIFAQGVGMPPHAWRNQLRVVRAIGLLRDGASVAEASTAVGFFDQSHFTRHFKRAYGVPPSTLAQALSRDHTRNRING